jgi:hypothetical protein
VGVGSSSAHMTPREPTALRGGWGLRSACPCPYGGVRLLRLGGRSPTCCKSKYVFVLTRSFCRARAATLAHSEPRKRLNMPSHVRASSQTLLWLRKVTQGMFSATEHVAAVPAA